MVVAVGQIIKFRAKYHNITVMSGFYWEALGRGCREERLKKTGRTRFMLRYQN